MAPQGYSVILALAVAGCATAPPMAWTRLDGKPFNEAEFQTVQTVCRGEMQKSNLAGFPSDSIGGAFRRGRAVDDVYKGCMADRGYMLTPAQ